MYEGICEDCQTDEQKANRQKEQVELKENREKLESEFKNVLFNWKFYIFPIIVGILFGFVSTFKTDINISGTGLIMGIIMAVSLKSSFGKKILMFFVSGFLVNILTFIIMLLTAYVINIVDGDSGKRQKVITGMLNMNNTMPIMLNNQLQIVKYSSPNNKTIIMHGRFINYTKNEILADYSNNISLFEAEMLKGEQKTSCPQANLKNLFSMGLEMNIEYLGKNNNIVGKINLNDEKCKPYYQ